MRTHIRNLLMRRARWLFVLVNGVRTRARTAVHRRRFRRDWESLRRTHGVLAIDHAQGHGFFANLNALLWMLAHGSAEQRPVDLRLTSGVYGRSPRGEDWLFDYFEFNGQGPTPGSIAPRLRIDLNESTGFNKLYEPAMTIERARVLLNDYASVRPEVLERVDAQFERNDLDPASTLGVHYRGTDKWTEASAIAAQSMIGAVRDLLATRGLAAVLVATDEPPFISLLQEAVDVRVVPVEANQLSGDGSIAAFRVETVDRYELGVEALLASLALSRCAHVVRTTSLLSAWSKVWNPELSTTTLNRALAADTFPETQVVADEVGRAGMG